MKLGLGCCAAALLSVGCAGPSPESPAGQTVTLEIAPLDLPGIADAVWDLKVENNRAPSPDQVWTARITSSRYGDGAGSASYVGPCDADPGMSANTVTVNIIGIYTAPVDSATVGAYGDPPPAGSEAFNDPGPLTRTFTCKENEDVFVDFDVSLMRPANQGFFDIAVNFNQLYCSAKFDCCYNDRGSDPNRCEPDEAMNLLFDATGARSASYVLGFACAAGGDAGVNTTLLLDNITVQCDGSGPVAAGNYTLDVNPARPAGNQGSAAPFSNWATYRGAEFDGAISKLYWNFAFGVGDANLTGCVLHTQGTADDAADLEDGADFGVYRGIAANITYPIIQWDVPLAYGGACTEHPLDTSSFVHTTYTPTVHSGRTFDYGVSAAGPLLPPVAPAQSSPLTYCRLDDSTRVTANGAYNTVNFTASSCGGALPPPASQGLASKLTACGQDEDWAVLDGDDGSFGHHFWLETQCNGVDFASLYVDVSALPAGDVIVCRYNPASYSPGDGGFIHTFTAAECGGVLPDATYQGVLSRQVLCGRDEDWRALDADEANGPGIGGWVSSSCASKTDWEVTYLRKSGAVMADAIECLHSDSNGNFGNGSHVYHFTAADCGGSLPDASYKGVLFKSTHCGRDDDWASLDPDEGGPGISFYLSAACPGYTFGVLYLKVP